MTDSVRRSARFGVAADGSSATDEDALQKAMRRKSSLNLEDKGNFMSSKSFLSFSPHAINSNLSSVGFKLGSNANQIDISTRVLRHMELDRLTIVPKASTELESTYTDEEEAIAISDGQLLSHIVGEVSEVDLDEDKLCSLYELKASGRKSKTFSNKKSGRRSTKSKRAVIRFPNEWHVRK